MEPAASSRHVRHPRKKKATSSRSSRPNTKSLSHGRPPTIRKTLTSLSHQTTNTVINTFHTLNKSLMRAQAAGDATTATTIENRIAQLGGLATYQRASIQGQDNRRGGDSSVVLVDWLRPILSHASPTRPGGTKPRLLEIGALSTKNACSTSQLFTVERIDLNSQGDGIQQQDFMQRPLPHATDIEKAEEERFDVLSLSLVLNFVPDIEQRGEMLRRSTEFLSRRHGRLNTTTDDAASPLPCMFLVLPAPCVTNSRYMSEERLAAIMASLGYSLLRRKQSPRLVYYLWKWRDNEVHAEAQDFPKKLLHDGKGRNNFAIVLKP